MTTKLPTSETQIRMDADLSRVLEKELKRYEGADLEKAQQAVRNVYHSEFAGSFGELVARYRAAIKEAVAE